MKIEASRLTLRTVSDTDAATILDAVKCPDIHLMHSNQFTSISKVQDYIDNLIKEYETGQYSTMAIADKNANALIGIINLVKDKTFPRAEISYWITSSHRNLGYATEAVSAIIAHGFNKLCLNRIQAMHFPANSASGQVLKKSGMQHEGILRQYV